MADVETPRDPPPADAFSLPARYYVDADFYQQELERFFLGRWFHAGRAEEVANRGDFVIREIAGESLIVVRGDDDRIRAFYNVCRHRGTRLCERPQGSFSGMIRCPYHAWAYDDSGALRAAPHMDQVAHFRVEDYPLHPARVGLWDGHVFLNLSDDPEPLESQIAGLADKFRPWGMEALRRAHRIVYDVAANWKLIVQNYSECLHCPGVHPALQRLSHFLSGVNEPPNPRCLGGAMDLRDGVETLSMDGEKTAATLPGLGADHARRVYYYAVLPNLLLSLHPDYMMTHTLWPRGVGRTEIVCEWHYHPDATASAGFRPQAAVEFWDMTNRQDWHVCEQMQLGLGSRAYRPGPYSSREDLLHAFDRLIREGEG
jgi:Rieske 2Fe-2S family protein